MENTELKKIQSIRKGYEEKQTTKLDELRALDKKVKLPAVIVAYIIGIIGALVLGTGMCLAMKVIGDMMTLGIIVGLIGIAMVVANYFIYQAILKARKKKYGQRIMALSDEIMHG